MPLFFQQDIDADSRIAIWKIEEAEEFFSIKVAIPASITHPHKRLQHLAGRYLLQYLFPDFPLELILIADTRKPFLQDESYHFSISHCGDYAAAIVSKSNRVGVDIEIPSSKVVRIKHKFLSAKELVMLNDWDLHAELGSENDQQKVGEFIFNCTTLLWSCKESMFKWWGYGSVDFRDMLYINGDIHNNEGKLSGRFKNDLIDKQFPIHFKFFPSLVLTWLLTPAG